MSLSQVFGLNGLLCSLKAVNLGEPKFDSWHGLIPILYIAILSCMNNKKDLPLHLDTHVINPIHSLHTFPPQSQCVLSIAPYIRKILA